MTAHTAPDMPNHEYHAEQHHLSSSGARTILEDPSLYQWQHAHPTPPTKAMTEGTIAHAAILENGHGLAIIDAADWRSKTAKEARQQAETSGNTPVLRAEWETMYAPMRDAFHAHPVAGMFAGLEGATTEQSIFWDDPETGCPCKARPDWQSPTSDLIIDYKTTGDASPYEFQRTIAKYGYHIQAAWYQDAIEHATGQRPDFLFIVQEKRAPWRLGIYQLDPIALDLGRRQAQQARETYQRCVRTGTWPGLSPAPVVVSLPAWYERAHEND